MFSKKKKSNYYYDSFPIVHQKAVDIMEKTYAFLENFDPSKVENFKNEIHTLEHQGDVLKHEVWQKLTTEFMTPIEREDIMELLTKIDDVTDAVEEIALKLYMYDYQELPPHTLEFLSVCRDCVRASQKVVDNFPSFMDQSVMAPLIKEVRELEEKCDAIYEKDMHDLYVLTAPHHNAEDGFTRHRGEAMYNMLEEITDRCKIMVSFVETITYKNL